MSANTDGLATLARVTDRVRDALRSSELASTAVRYARLRRRRPRWSSVAAPLPGIGSAAGRVLVATSVGGHLTGSTLETMLAAALRLRGADVHALLCDAALPACLECTTVRLNPARMATHGPRGRLCPGCFAAGAAGFGDLAVPVHRYGDLVTVAERAEAQDVSRAVPLDGMAGFRLDGVAVGEHALAGALRYFARADLGGEPHSEAVARRYLEAAVITQRAVERLTDQHAFDVAVFHHGIYVPQGIVGEVMRHRGIRVVNWNPAYRQRSFVFSHGDTYHHTLMEEPTEAWEGLDLIPERERALLDYLRSRWSGARDWIWFHERPTDELETIAAEVGIDFDRPTIGMLTNVMWDAQLHYPANAFRDMRGWVMTTIQYFADRPDLQLLIRVHPAEIRGSLPSRQPIVEEIRDEFPQLPSNVFVVPPESSVSTYAAMSQCDAVIIYGTKTGVELSAVGVPVIVAGEAWIRGKGVTLDASSAEEYLATLDRLPLGTRLDEETVERARKYAYHFFFRRMIPLGFVEPTGGDPVFSVTVESLDELLPGRDPGLDVICDGILHGTPFIYPAEALAMSVH